MKGLIEGMVLIMMMALFSCESRDHEYVTVSELDQKRYEQTHFVIGQTYSQKGRANDGVEITFIVDVKGWDKPRDLGIELMLLLRNHESEFFRNKIPVIWNGTIKQIIIEG